MGWAMRGPLSCSAPAGDAARVPLYVNWRLHARRTNTLPPFSPVQHHALPTKNPEPCGLLLSKSSHGVLRPLLYVCSKIRIMKAGLGTSGDLDEEAAMKDPQKASALSAKAHQVYEILNRRKLESTALALICVLVFSWEARYAGRSVFDWCLIGVGAPAAGALLGVAGGVCMGDVTVSRVGCGSWDGKGCSIWWRDACSALYALAVALVATCSVGGLCIGTLALLLLGSVHLDQRLGLELPDWVREDIMIATTALLFVFAAVRFFFKTRECALPATNELPCLTCDPS